MTGLEFIAAGVVFEPTPAGVRVRGPDGRSDLLEQLRFEVATRTPLVETDTAKVWWIKTPWCCDICSDQIGHDVKGKCALCGLRAPDGRKLCSFVYGGFCLLCVLARQLARQKEFKARVGSK